MADQHPFQAQIKAVLDGDTLPDAPAEPNQPETLDEAMARLKSHLRTGLNWQFSEAEWSELPIQPGLANLTRPATFAITYNAEGEAEFQPNPPSRLASFMTEGEGNDTVRIDVSIRFVSGLLALQLRSFPQYSQPMIVRGDLAPLGPAVIELVSKTIVARSQRNSSQTKPDAK